MRNNTNLNQTTNEDQTMMGLHHLEYKVTDFKKVQTAIGGKRARR